MRVSGNRASIQTRFRRQQPIATSAGTENGLNAVVRERGSWLDSSDDSADGRARDEAEAEGDADQPHALGPVFPGCDIGDGGGCHGKIAAHGASKQAREHEQPEGSAESPQQVAKGSPATVSSSTGRRPMRSDAHPRRAQRNCSNE